MKSILKNLKFLIILLITPSFLINNLNVYSSEIEKINIENYYLEEPDPSQEYILGPGDFIEFNYRVLDLSLPTSIGPDGFIYLPEIGQILAGGKTIRELKKLIDKKASKYIFDPDVEIYIRRYRNLNVYVGGEVKRPGYYELEVANATNDSNIPFNGQRMGFPTLFDALKTASGISPYSDLSNITIIRKNTLSKGGGNLKANINLLSLFSDGDLSQNIKLFDGDSIFVQKTNEPLSNQLLLAKNHNINPAFINVFISGYIDDGGLIKLPQGSTLNQAIAMAGGEKLLSGKVVFKRFLNDGETTYRKFKYDRRAPYDSYKNPVLSEGDIIDIENSIFNNTNTVIGTLANPMITIYGIKSILDDL